MIIYVLIFFLFLSLSGKMLHTCQYGCEIFKIVSESDEFCNHFGFSLEVIGRAMPHSTCL